MEYHTQQHAVPKIEENPLQCDYLGYYYQDPLPNNTTSMSEAPQIDHGFNSVPLPLTEDYNQNPHMGFQGLEGYSLWDSTVLDIATTFSSSPHCDYDNVLDEKTRATVLESFGEPSNGPSETMIESSGFSNIQCDSVVFDSTMVGSFDYLINNSTDLGHHANDAMIECSGLSSYLCDYLVYDEMPIREMESLNNNVPNFLGQYEVPMMNESSGFSSSHCDSMVLNEYPISTMVESFDNSINVPSVLDHHEAHMMKKSAAFSSSHCNVLTLYETPLSTLVDSFDYSATPIPDLSDDEASMMTETAAAFSSSHCNSLALYEPPLPTYVDHFDYSDTDLSDDEVSVKIESGFPSWGTSDISRKRGTSNRRRSRYNTQMKIKTGALELEDIKQYFNFPISEAAKELKVGVTLLKRRCRELNIMRWPHRKIKSLNSLIETMKALGLRNEVKLLEENKRLLEQVPNMELTKRTKKLRQSVFKANYNKKKMSLSFHLDDY